MNNIIPICCPKFNSLSLYKFGKDKFGNQKYQCRNYKHQFDPIHIKSNSSRKYPSCPVCNKASFLHHDYDNYSFFRVKPNLNLPTSMSNIVGKDDFKRMRHSIHIIISALTMFYILEIFFP